MIEPDYKHESTQQVKENYENFCQNHLNAVRIHPSYGKNIPHYVPPYICNLHSKPQSRSSQDRVKHKTVKKSKITLLRSPKVKNVDNTIIIINSPLIV